MATKVAVELVPWDPQSEEHIKRLTLQRVQCGWDIDAVTPDWRDKQLAGKKCIYWIILSARDPQTAELLAQHTKAFPDEATSLKDTAQAIRGAARTPTGADVLPVGHISLDVSNPLAVRFGLELDLPSENVYWIKSLYVSQVLQGQRIGSSAMDLIETMAAEAPLHAQTLALDTLLAEDQMKVFAELGVHHRITNQAWYTRRGYRLIKTVKGFYNESAGGTDVTQYHAVFMRRDLH